MIFCDFCDGRHREDALRSFRPNYMDGDPQSKQPGGRVHICRTCDPKRERFIRLLEKNRINYAKLKEAA